MTQYISLLIATVYTNTYYVLISGYKNEILLYIFAFLSETGIIAHLYFLDYCSGSLPVNAHAEVNILNLNYITALYFILLTLYCQIICPTINNRGAYGVIFVSKLYICIPGRKSGILRIQYGHAAAEISFWT